jgi:hypothetical protein
MSARLGYAVQGLANARPKTLSPTLSHTLSRRMADKVCDKVGDKVRRRWLAEGLPRRRREQKRPRAHARASKGSDFGRAVSRFLSALLRAERIICLSSRYPGPVPQGGTWSGQLLGPLFGLAPDGVFRASALALGAVGSYPAFSPLPAPLAKRRRFILCGTFRRHALRRGLPRVSCASLLASAPQVTRHRALWCSDFPPPPDCSGESDSPPFQNRCQCKGWPGRLQGWPGMRVRLTVWVSFGPRRRSAISNLQFTIGNYQFPAWSKGRASRDCSRSAGVLVRSTVLTQLGRCCGRECPRSGGSVEIRPSKDRGIAN